MQGISNDFLDACVQVIRCGFGMPAFNNDEMVIPEFIKLGIEPQERLRLRSDWLYRNRRRWQMGLSLYRHELYQLRPRDAGGAGRRA